jgi:LPXTG-motif cell wall-anchored protein
MGAQRVRRRLVAAVACLIPVLAAQPALAAASGSQPRWSVAAAGGRASAAVPDATVAVLIRRAHASPSPSSSQGPAPAGVRPAARHLPTTGFDGMLVAAVGVALTGLGWLLLLSSGRRYRRRSRWPRIG